MSYSFIFRSLYGLVHGIFTLLEWIFDVLEGSVDGVVDFCHEFYLKHRTGSLRYQIQKSKIPNHLTVLLGQERPSYKDLANVVIWCMLNHINFLSFYDPKDILYRHNLEKELAGKLHPRDHIFWHDSPGLKHKNGFVGRKIHIKIFTQHSGREGVVNLTKALSKTTEKEIFSVQKIDESLYKYFEFPDPELGLCCGKNMNFFDYPPWQMRLTEFLSIKSHHRLSYRKFLEQLSIYSKCDQRNGK